jgi:hypothetical protein
VGSQTQKEMDSDMVWGARRVKQATITGCGQTPTRITVSIGPVKNDFEFQERVYEYFGSPETATRDRIATHAADAAVRIRVLIGTASEAVCMA